MLQVTFKGYFNFLRFSILSILNIFLQVNQNKRPTVTDELGNPQSDEILKVLESLARKIQIDPKIEADWRTSFSLIKVSAEFKVDERTLSSRDLFKEITQMNLKAKSGQMATTGTKLHDQKDTNFCAYFATMSALRHQLRKIVGSAKNRNGEDIKEYLERRDEVGKRFERDLSVMIGCVSPRSLSARFKITFKNILTI